MSDFAQMGGFKSLELVVAVTVFLRQLRSISENLHFMFDFAQMCSFKSIQLVAVGRQLLGNHAVNCK